MNALSATSTEESAATTATRARAKADDRSWQPLGVAERYVVVMVGALAALVGWSRRWTADDAYISFRAVENLLAGNGLVFNAGERVEVTTSPLWSYLLAAGDLVIPGNAVAWLSVIGGLVLSVAGVVLGCLGCARLRTDSGPRTLLLPFGSLVFLALPPVWDFITSGLETGLVFGWLGLCWWGLSRLAVSGAGRGCPVWLLVTVGLGPLIRPDLGVVTVGLALYVTLSSTRSLHRRALDLLVAAALPVAYEIFRMGYYGLLVPNTALAKESSRALWARGWTYLADFIAPYWLLLPAAAVVVATSMLVWRLRARRPELGLVVTFLLIATVHVLFVVRVGGDFMHARLLLPGTMMALLPVFLVPVALRRFVSLGLVAVVAAWALVCGTSLRVAYQDDIGPSGIADERGVYVTEAGSAHPVTLEDHRGNGALREGAQVNAAQRGGDSVVFSQFADDPADPDRLAEVGRGNGRTYFGVFQAGYLGAASNLDVFVDDYYGLTDPVGAHLTPGAPGRPGHEKIFPASWFWARYGDGTPIIASPHPIVGTIVESDVAEIRQVLACGRVAELIQATNAPLSWSRFWGNVTGAYNRTALRISPDPAVAHSEFC